MGADGPPTTPRRLCHFYVVIPPGDEANSSDVSGAVSTAEELSAILKRNPRARFQAGGSAEEAKQRALEKIQFTQDTESILSPAPDRRRARSSLSAIESSLGAPVLESPKTHDLLMMGREITTKQIEKVIQRIENNPRILCTETEFPTTLHEGCKYNALHLAAKSNNFEIVGYILNIVSSFNFMKRIYPNVSDDIRRSSTKHLVTCYLNTPDKMTQETPLHYACKFNAVESAELLLSHPWCDKDVTNFEGLTPYEVIGTRAETKGTKAEAIRTFFKENFIVPIWRDEDVIGDPPVIGEVACIPDLGRAIPPPLLAKFPDFSISLLDNCPNRLLPAKTLRLNSIKVFTSIPPDWKIKAFAGPTTKEAALELRRCITRSRCLRIPPTSPDTSMQILGGSPKPLCVSPPSSPLRNYNDSPPPNQLCLSPLRSPLSLRSLYDSAANNCSPRMDMSLRVRDAEKGLERVVSEYCQDMDIPWFEYWPFLGTFCNLTSEAGIDLLENHLRDLEEKKINEDVEEEVVINAFEESGGFGHNNTLDDLADRFDVLDLDGSGMSSPRRKEECTNPRCRLESRWCNCDNVIPSLPMDGANKADLWVYGDNDEEEYNFGGDQQHQPFMGIRKLGASANTLSFEASQNSSNDSQSFAWPSPEGDILGDLFETAPSSPVLVDDVFEDCCNQPVFLSGDKPGKLDYQVFQILQDFDDEMDKTKHRATFQWLNSLIASGKTSGRWRTGAFCGYSPRKLWEPSFVSTPVRTPRKLEDSF